MNYDHEHGEPPDQAQEDFPYAEAPNYCPPSKLLKCLMQHAEITEPKQFHNPLGFKLSPLAKKVWVTK